MLELSITKMSSNFSPKTLKESTLSGNFNLLEEPACIARPRAFREGDKNGNYSNHSIPLRGGGLGLFFFQKNGCFGPNHCLFYGPFYLKNVIRGGHLTEYALNLFQFCFIPIILGLAQR